MQQSPVAPPLCINLHNFHKHLTEFKKCFYFCQRVYSPALLTTQTVFIITFWFFSSTQCPFQTCWPLSPGLLFLSLDLASLVEFFGGTLCSGRNVLCLRLCVTGEVMVNSCTDCLSNCDDLWDMRKHEWLNVLCTHMIKLGVAHPVFGSPEQC